jgi:hypothetical protein
MPNPKRPSNPFTPSPEPDWVDVQRMGGRPEPPPARGSQRARTVDFNNTSQQQSSQAPARKLIVPAFPTHATQTANFDGSRDALNDLRRSGSVASTRSLPTRPGPGGFTQTSQPQPQRTGPQVLRKPAPPPIPNKKPALLSKNSAQSTPQSQYRDEPRRSVADRRPVPNFMDDDGGAKPPLPPRTGTGLSNGSANGRGDGGGRSFMDDEAEDMAGLRGWEVLQPQGGR